MCNLIIDFGHLTHRMLFANAPVLKETGMRYLRPVLIDQIFNLINKFDATKVFIACDSKFHWRKKIYPLYKENRVDAREKKKELVDWQEFYKLLDNLICELQEVFNFYTLNISNLEADDIIGILVRDLPKDEQKMIITGDTDYIQLLSVPNTKIYDGKSKKFLTSKCPSDDLLKKIILGDNGDNIPNVQKRLGIKTLEKMLENNELEPKLTEVDINGNKTEFCKNYERNRQLIDLTFTPIEYIKDTKDFLSNYKLPTSAKLFNYVIEFKLMDMFNKLDYYRRVLDKLYSTEQVILS